MKPEQKEILRERARSALRDLYHNATITYPRELYGRSEDYADSWIQDAAQFEIEYIKGGGAYGSNYRKTLEAPCNAGKYQSERAQRYYVAKGMRAIRAERNDCGAFTGWKLMENAALYYGRGIIREQLARNDALWETITDYGELYQWGRGGCTLAPNDLIRTGGGSSFSIREDYADEMQPAALVDFIRVIESFNRIVGAWCKHVPEMWREHCAEIDADAKAEKARIAAAKAKETRERNYWAFRGMVTQ